MNIFITKTQFDIICIDDFVNSYVTFRFLILHFIGVNFNGLSVYFYSLRNADNDDNN